MDQRDGSFMDLGEAFDYIESKSYKGASCKYRSDAENATKSNNAIPKLDTFLRLLQMTMLI